MAPISTRPGVLLVHPRLRSPNESNVETFHRWTKLHFNDLLNIPADASSGADIDACVRGVAPEGAIDYSHEEKAGMKPAYMYTCFLGDIGVVKSQPYYNVSRKLNLEQTRSLGKNEKPVEYHDKKAMVFDIVDTKFAVYEEIKRATASWRLRDAVSSASSSGISRDMIIRVNLRTPNMWDLQLAKKAADHLEINLESTGFGVMTRTGMVLYRWAGKEAQPDEHPLIDEEGRAEWMILMFAECSPLSSYEDSIPAAKDAIGKCLQDFAKGIGNHETDKLFECGVWMAEPHNRGSVGSGQ